MKKILLFLMLTMMTVVNVSAQVRWKGTDQSTLANGTQVFLYNVGTGRFVIHGGDWGTQARLFYEDTGKLMSVQKTNTQFLFKTGVNTGDAAVLGMNVPRVTSIHDWTGNSDQETWTMLMDANANFTGASGQTGTRNVQFSRVSGTDDDVYTYYIYERLNGGANGDSTVYWGATYGENWGHHEGDPNGKLVLLSSSYDKVVWSTVVPTSTATYDMEVKSAEKEGLPEGTTTVNRGMTSQVPIFNAETKIPLNTLYQWRIVTLEQMLEQLDVTSQADISDGLSSNLTHLIIDRGFERNDNNFFTGWSTGTLSNQTYSTSDGYRYKYTWGFVSQDTQHQSGTTTEAWNRPVRLKSQWTDKEKAKYGFMEFEGAGTAYTSLNTTSLGLKPGYYKIGCYGWYQGNNPAYLFASTTTPDDVAFDALTKSQLKEVSGEPYDNSSKINGGDVTSDGNGGYTKNGVMGAGYDFVYNKNPYYREVQIQVTEGQTIYLGVVKNGATKSSADSGYGGTVTRKAYITYTSDGITYYLNSNLRFVQGETNAYLWTISSSDLITDDNGNYLKYSSGTTEYLVSGTSTQNSVSYSNGYVVETNYTSYYLTGNTSSSAPTFARNAPDSNRARVQIQSESISGGTYYYHDTDWVGVDQFEIFYLGTDKPVLFDEDEESLTYLKESENVDKQYNNRTVRLHRAFKKGQWNSFVFPLDMTAVQVRNAFGDDCKLMKLCDLGYISGYTHVLDFESVPLPAEGAAVEAGNFYLIQPTKDPSTPSGANEKNYYTIGRFTFNTSDMNNIHPDVVSKATTTKDGTPVIDDNPVTKVTTYATYVATTNYNSYGKAQIDNVSAVTNGVYAPARAYVISDNKVYHIKTPTRIKGFRGWIMDTAAEAQENPVKVYFNGEIVDDDMATEIIEAIADTPIAVDGIYDLMGRRVQSNDLNALPKGLYIVNGKKMLVK